MTESFRRHHASGCANQTKVRRIPLLHSRATSKVSTPPLCMRATTASLRDTDAGPVWFCHPTREQQLVSDARKQPHGNSATPQEGSNYARKQPRSDTATPQEGSKPAPFGLLLGALFTRRTLPRRDPPRRTLPRRIFAPGSQDQRCRIAHRKVASQQPLQWNANLAVLCPQ